MKRGRVVDFYFGNQSPSSEKRKFTDFNSAQGSSSKMWIFPDGRAAASTVRHYEWLLANADFVKKYGLVLDKLPKEEDPIRRAALGSGFVRLNYEHKDGRLVVEAVKSKFSKRVRAALVGIVAGNAPDLYWITVTLFDAKKGRLAIAADKTVRLFDYPDEQKAEHIPSVSDQRRGNKSAPGAIKLLVKYRRQLGADYGTKLAELRES